MFQERKRKWKGDRKKTNKNSDEWKDCNPEHFEV